MEEEEADDEEWSVDWLLVTGRVADLSLTKARGAEAEEAERSGEEDGDEMDCAAIGLGCSLSADTEGAERELVRFSATWMGRTSTRCTPLPLPLPLPDGDGEGILADRRTQTDDAGLTDRKADRSNYSLSLPRPRTVQVTQPVRPLNDSNIGGSSG